MREQDFSPKQILRPNSVISMILKAWSYICSSSLHMIPTLILLLRTDAEHKQRSDGQLRKLVANHPTLLNIRREHHQHTPCLFWAWFTRLEHWGCSFSLFYQQCNSLFFSSSLSFSHPASHSSVVQPPDIPFPDPAVCARNTVGSRDLWLMPFSSSPTTKYLFNCFPSLCSLFFSNCTSMHAEADALW